MQQYFIRFPFLRKRIIFTGQIENKADLIREYQLAKIFTLTSRVEGGTPNVIAESLFSGCYQVLTNFDAASEATDNGQCGVVVRDIKDLEDKLLLLCNDDRRLLEGGRNAIDFAKKIMILI
nr:CAZy families GT4 protein [uncultured Clostridium sp.]